jgi:hypothetical protein
MYFDQSGEPVAGLGFNARSFLLLGSFVMLAALVWWRGVLPRDERAGLLTVCPLLVFCCWILFQPGQFSFVPGQWYSAGMDAFVAWRTNHWICLGFGVVYSVAVLLLPGFWRRCWGGVFLVLFLALACSNKFQFWLSYRVTMFFPHGN